MNHFNYKDIFSFQGIKIGVTIENSWIIRKGDHFLDLRFDSISNTIFWLPILEIDYNEFTETLKGALETLKRKDLIPKLLDSLPINEMLNIALLSDSKYWVKLAMEWVDKIPDKNIFANALERICKDKKYSQKLRHASMKYLAQIRRNNHN
ncbi:MAG TPA: hypothetical protein VNS32_23240 [Flavisolibacter sp.]|nr:hypothetical protein [Flavisolibacter sp.]